MQVERNLSAHASVSQLPETSGGNKPTIDSQQNLEIIHDIQEEMGRKQTAPEAARHDIYDENIIEETHMTHEQYSIGQTTLPFKMDDYPDNVEDLLIEQPKI